MAEVSAPHPRIRCPTTSLNRRCQKCQPSNRQGNGAERGLFRNWRQWFSFPTRRDCVTIYLILTALKRNFKIFLRGNVSPVEARASHDDTLRLSDFHPGTPSRTLGWSEDVASITPALSVDVVPAAQDHHSRATQGTVNHSLNAAVLIHVISFQLFPNFPCPRNIPETFP